MRAEHWAWIQPSGLNLAGYFDCGPNQHLPRQLACTDSLGHRKHPTEGKDRWWLFNNNAFFLGHNLCDRRCHDW